MRVLTSTAALAALALSLTLAALPASAAGSDTTFDLGVNVNDVLPTTHGVDAYLAGLEPETQAAIMGACNTFMQNPTDARSDSTLAFCQVAVGAAPAATSNIKTFASVLPIIPSQPATRTIGNIAPHAAASNNASGTGYNVFPSEDDPNYGLNN